MADRLLRPDLESRFLEVVGLVEACRSAGVGGHIEFTEVPRARGLKWLVDRSVREHLPTPSRLPDADLADLEELDERGLLAVSAEPSRNGKRGRLRLTDAGVLYAERALAPSATAAPNSGGVGLEWETDVAPILRALYDVQSALPPNAYGASQEQVNQQLGRPPDDPRTDRVLADLAKAGYLDDVLENDARLGPISCRLSEKGLQEVAGWPHPGGSSPIEAFLSALDNRLADPEISEEQRGWLLKMRDAAGNMSQSVMSSLLTAYIKSQTGI